jgi:hypothetical protein
VHRRACLWELCLLRMAHGNDSTLCWLIHTEPLCSALPTAVAAAVSCPHTEPVARRSLKRRLCTAEHLPAHNGIQCSVLPARRQQCSGACTNAMGRREPFGGRRFRVERSRPTAKADGRVVHASHGIFHVAVAAAIAVQRLAAILRRQSATAAPCAMEHAWL